MDKVSEGYQNAVFRQRLCCEIGETIEEMIMGSKIDISVIIPAHNAVDFLERAVQSVRAQEILSWELILVENGSGDQTLQLCEALSCEDGRIRVFQSDKGVSRARNRGLSEAQGDWVCFLDADDYLYPDAFRVLSEIISGEKRMEGSADCEMVLFGHNSGKTGLPGTSEIYAEEQKYLEFRCHMLENPTKYMPVWGKLFLRSKIEKYHLWFNEELELAEDADFTFRFMRYCSRICVSEAQLYHYSEDTVSAVRGWKPGKDEKYIKSLEYMESYMTEECRTVQEAFSCFVAIHLLLILVHDTFAAGNPASNKEKRKRMKELLRYRLFSEAIKSISLSRCGNVRMIPILCFKLKLNFLAVLAVKIRVRQKNM